jgi:hypothetical protein
MDMEETVAATIGDAGEPCVVVGPCCFQPTDGKMSKRWYFSVLTCGPDKQFRTDRVDIDPSWGEGSDGAHAARESFLEVLATRKSVAVLDASDELTAVRWGESLWPGERITRLRQDMEAEYRARGWDI